MLLNQMIIINSSLYCVFIGLVWFSLVYLKTINSMHLLPSTKPLNQYICMLHEVKIYSLIFSLSYRVCSDYWFSGLVRVKSSILFLKTPKTKVNQTKPHVSFDIENVWFSARRY